MSFIIRDKECPRCEAPLNQDLVWSNYYHNLIVVWFCPDCWGKDEFWLEVITTNGLKMGLATKEGVILW